MKLRLFCGLSFLVALLIISCAQTVNEKKPADLIPEEKFADVMVDVRLLEGAYAGDFQRVDSSEFTMGEYYEQLFARHQITRLSFLESSEYYAHDAEKMLRIETEVGKKLEILSAE